MVVPLITGAARVAKTKSVIKKANKVKGSQKAIAYQRTQKFDKKNIAHVHPSRHKPAHDLPTKKYVNTNGAPQRRKMADTLLHGPQISKKKMRAVRRGAMVLGYVLYPMIMQLVFAIVVLIALAVEDSWWGWIDIIDASLTVASIFWIFALILGTYTMIIAIFRMSMYLHHWKVVLAFIFCFSANWAPLLQIVPWVGVWILFIMIHER